MKRIIILLVFIVSLFIFIDKINADYKATVLNDATASCNLRSGSTGYCYYSNSSLNSYVSNVVWLDTGDEVTVLTSHGTVNSPNKQLCPDHYVYTSFLYNNNLYNGYYCNHYLISETNITDAMREEFQNAGFPESYFSKLATLKTAHPNWSFVAINTNINFNEAVENETYGARSLLRGSMSNGYSYLSLDSNSFDYYNNRFIAYDDTTGSDPWFLVNRNTIAYYMDPRNFLKDEFIFQFNTLSYDSTVSDDKLKASINSIFGSDYLNTFTDTFVEAGKISKVNPIYLASLSKEEVQNGATPGAAISGQYNGMYNFYNIGANSGSNPVYNGLNFAAGNDPETLRPWNTEYKAIVGGAKWIFNNYVAPGQDTSYFKKFDVVHDYLISIGRTPTHSDYTHQYMQNIMAPSSEAAVTYRSYYKNGLLGLNYTFYIPVYKNMPTETKLPTNTGWPNNYLSSLKINNNPVAGFDGAVEEYNYNLDVNEPILKLEASKVSSNAKVEGTGTFEIKENTTKIIKVTAQNGNVKNYKINVKLTGTLIQNPVDVQTTLNNAGIKNGDKYITGIAPKTDINVIKQKILNIRSDASIVMTNSNNQAKESGKIFTGDKIQIQIDEDSREYEFVIYGDINGDGEINALDFILIRKQMLKQTNLAGAKYEAADMNKDGSINALDFILIRKFMLGDANAIVQ